MAGSYVKRRAEDMSWEDQLRETTIKMMQDRVSSEDPFGGRWNAPMSVKGVVWCDTRSIATGMILETDDKTVVAWLREDYNHNNVAELDAVLKGVKLALKWSL